MQSRPCSNCRDCEKRCGRGSTLLHLSGISDAVDVYNAVVSLHSLDRTILEFSSEKISRDLVFLGFLQREPNPADLESALELVASAEL